MSFHQEEWQTREILIAVKAYPTPSKKYQETVCVAGIALDNYEWIRLYPVPFRDLPYYQRFKKYDVISARVKRHTSDPRPESYRLDLESLKVLCNIPPVEGWRKRKEIILPTLDDSMCRIQQLQADTRKSIGIFEPARIEDFIIEDAPQQWGARNHAILSQMSLFNPKKKVLEKIPLAFKYRYFCEADDCPGHTQSIIDWEVGQAYRNWRNKYGTGELLKQKLREKFFDEICSEDRDTYLIVGNHSLYPKVFMILGIFWPPRTDTNSARR